MEVKCIRTIVIYCNLNPKKAKERKIGSNLFFNHFVGFTNKEENDSCGLLIKECLYVILTLFSRKRKKKKKKLKFHTKIGCFSFLKKLYWYEFVIYLLRFSSWKFHFSSPFPIFLKIEAHYFNQTLIYYNIG